MHSNVATQKTLISKENGGTSGTRCVERLTEAIKQVRINYTVEGNSGRSQVRTDV